MPVFSAGIFLDPPSLTGTRVELGQSSVQEGVAFRVGVHMICKGNSVVSWSIWDKYQESYFQFHQNVTHRKAEN